MLNNNQPSIADKIKVTLVARELKRRPIVCVNCATTLSYIGSDYKEFIYHCNNCGTYQVQKHK